MPHRPEEQLVADLVVGGLRGTEASLGELDLLTIDLDGNDLQVLLTLLEATQSLMNDPGWNQAPVPC